MEKDIYFESIKEEILLEEEGKHYGEGIINGILQ